MKTFTLVFLCIGTFVLAVNSQPCMDIGRSCTVDENCCPGSVCNINRRHCIERCGTLGMQCGGSFGCCHGRMCRSGTCCIRDGYLCRENFQCCSSQCVRDRCAIERG
ncbi:ITG-like peptide isoform X2 [Leptopilina heterotoma]|uniref:ITG-like peptide isoform X2 n=1 Tax=Leptopilina heterotoma TaxID=63436 RepID=UPI001CA8357A|nr:ITG-like peptide isoform X2 [Leptopilina heterotoma]